MVLPTLVVSRNGKKQGSLLEREKEGQGAEVKDSAQT